VPVLPAWIIDPVWDQFQALLPEQVDTHPLGCHRPRVPDRVVFDMLMQILVFGCGDERVADRAPGRRLRRPALPERAGTPRRDRHIAARGAGTGSKPAAAGTWNAPVPG
jgi:hypothetical protein